ncbi:MAG: glycosyltransferase [Bacteroidales bacterium]|nr:glycosyltransferase [Bacteroidales bacterium]
MKILLVNWIYGQGSTGIICKDLLSHFKKEGHDVIVATWINKTSDVEVKSVTKRWYNFIYWRLLKIGWPKYAAGSRSNIQLEKLIKDFNPDVVNLHVINNGFLNLYRLLSYLAKNKIKTVVTHHAEYYYTGSCGYSYKCDDWFQNQCKSCLMPNKVTGACVGGNPHRMWKLMKRSFDNFSNENLLFTAVSPWVTQRSIKSPIVNRFQCFTILNGVDTSIYYRRIVTREFLNKIENLNSKIALHVTAKFDSFDRNNIKGGYYLVELAKRMNNVTFIVVATDCIINNSLPSNIYVWGRSESREELANLYSISDVTVLTSYKETFSMICAESTCCGTPVVGFYAGGPETICIPEFCTFVDHGDVELLCRELNNTLLKTFDKNKISQMAIMKYSKEKMANSYLRVYKKIID